MARIVVTGGAGFIGSHLVDELVRDGHSVCVVDDLSSGHRENLAQSEERIDFIEGPVQEAEVSQQACRGADCIFHLAARASVPESFRDPLGNHNANVTGTVAMLTAARDHSVKRFIFASSASVYGQNPQVPQTIDLPLNPASPYAASKAAGEQYSRVFGIISGLETVVLRFFNVFGPRQRPGSAYASVIPSFINAMLAGNPPVIEGDGKQARDFVYVRDLICALKKALIVSNASGRTYNVAGGRQTSVLELYEQIRDILGTDLEPVFVAARAGDVRTSWADISVTRSALDFTPAFSFEHGLRETIDWYRENYS
jgi:nucleoside-diphosphate-sugar epimerase